jgi:uncharacterized membrane protein YkoI
MMGFVKRLLTFGTVLLIVLVLAGCKYIGGEKAIDVALADLKITRVGAARTDATLDKESDPVSYTVKIHFNDYVAVYIINAETSNIISIEREAR